MNMKKLIQPSSAPSERLWRLPMMTALAVCLCLFASGALAQTTGSATLRGSVKDANGAVTAVRLHEETNYPLTIVAS